MSSVIEHAVESYRHCAKGDRLTKAVKAAAEDDAIADLLEYIGSLSEENRNASPDLISITVLAEIFSEAYLSKFENPPHIHD